MSNVHLDMSEVVSLASDLGETAGVVTAAKLATSKAAHDMVDHMRADAPVRTGELRADIDLVESDGGWEGGSTVDQGFFQEFGTVNHPPQPWAFHNADKAESALVQSIEDIPIL